MSIFFTGCTHFGHANIIPLTNRPFSSVEEMDEALIERWNATVSPKDTVYHLGDFAYRISGGKTEQDYLSRLNGRINFIVGNHDDEARLKKTNAEDVRIYREISHLNQNTKKKFVLFHYPIDDWNGRFNGSIHLHCHTHSPVFENPHLPYLIQSTLDYTTNGDGDLPRRYPKDLKCNRFNVGMDATNFYPVSIEEILVKSRVSSIKGPHLK